MRVFGNVWVRLVALLLVTLLLLGSLLFAMLRLQTLSSEQVAQLAQLHRDEQQLRREQTNIASIQHALLLPAIRSNADSIAGLLARLDTDEAGVVALTAEITALEHQIASISLRPGPSGPAGATGPSGPPGPRGPVGPRATLRPTPTAKH